MNARMVELFSTSLRENNLKKTIAQINDCLFICTICAIPLVFAKSGVLRTVKGAAPRTHCKCPGQNHVKCMLYGPGLI